jgi:hypothetical protein
VGAILSTIGGDCQPSSQVPQSTTANKSAAIALHQTARRRKRPRCRPGRRNVPRAPDPTAEAIPSHPLPTMGGTSTPTTTHTKSARANDRDPRLPMSSAFPSPMTFPSPTLQPFTIEGGTSTYSGGDSMIPSATMASLFHRGSVHDKSTVLIVFVGIAALEPPIHRSLVTDADIGLGPPTYHPRPLKWWGFSVWDLFKIPHMPPAGSLKVLHALARRGGIRRAPKTKIYNLETREFVSNPPFSKI